MFKTLIAYKIERLTIYESINEMSFCEHCGDDSSLCLCAVPLPTLERQTNQPHNPQPTTSQCLVKDCVACLTATHGPAHLVKIVDGKRVPCKDVELKK
jgi:hypothetical protein